MYYLGNTTLPVCQRHLVLWYVAETIINTIDYREDEREITLMTNLSITNLEQSKLLAKAGLAIATADFSVLVKITKENGIITIEQLPYPKEAITYNQGIADNENYTAAWSLGKLIDLLPQEIVSQYDIEDNEQPEPDGVIYDLTIEKNCVSYTSYDHRMRYCEDGNNVLDAVVNMVLRLIKDDIELGQDTVDAEDDY